MLRREAPHLYRKAKDDLFTESLLIRKKVETDIKTRVTQSVQNLYKDKANQKWCQTDIKDLSYGIKLYKVVKNQQIEFEINGREERGV